MGLWMWIAAAWAASVDVWGACPGALTVEVGGLDPGEEVVLRVGDEVDPRARVGGVCDGMVLDVPAIREVRAVAGTSGYVTWAAQPGSVSCDRVIQVVRPDRCEALPAVDLRSPACARGGIAQTDAELGAFAACRVAGPVLVMGGVTRVELPELVVAEDVVVGQNHALASVSLPALRRVRGSVVLSGLTAPVDLGQLRRVLSLTLWQVGNEDVDLRRLARVSDQLDIGGWGAFVAPALVHVGRFVVGGATVSVSLPSLEEVHAMTVSSAPWLESLVMPALTRIGGVSRVEDVPALAQIDLASLVEVDDFAVQRNPNLCPEDGVDGWPKWDEVTWYAALRLGDNAPGCFGMSLP
jgi:hypothetical protein